MVKQKRPAQGRRRQVGRGRRRDWIGRRWRDGVDGCRGVVGQRETDLAMVAIIVDVGAAQLRRAQRRRDAAGKERQRVMMPTKEDRLKQDGKDAEPGGYPVVGPSAASRRDAWRKADQRRRRCISIHPKAELAGETR